MPPMSDARKVLTALLLLLVSAASLVTSAGTRSPTVTASASLSATTSESETLSSAASGTASTSGSTSATPTTSESSTVSAAQRTLTKSLSVTSRTLSFSDTSSATVFLSKTVSLSNVSASKTSTAPPSKSASWSAERSISSSASGSPTPSVHMSGTDSASLTASLTNITSSKTASALQSASASQSRAQSSTASATITNTESYSSTESRSPATASGSASAPMSASQTNVSRSRTTTKETTTSQSSSGSGSSTLFVTNSASNTCGRTLSSSKSATPSPSRFLSASVTEILSKTLSHSHVMRTRTRTYPKTKSFSDSGYASASASPSDLFTGSVTITPPPTPSHSRSRATASASATSATISLTVSASQKHTLSFTHSPSRSRSQSRTEMQSLSASASTSRTQSFNASHTISVTRNVSSTRTITLSGFASVSVTSTPVASETSSAQLSSTKSRTKIPSPSASTPQSKTVSETGRTPTRSSLITVTRRTEQLTQSRSVSGTVMPSLTRSITSYRSRTSSATERVTQSKSVSTTRSLTNNVSHSRSFNLTDTWSKSLALTPSKTLLPTPSGTKTNVSSRSTSLSSSIDPCGKVQVRQNEEFFRYVTVDPPIGRLVNGSSEFLIVSRIDFQYAGTITMFIHLNHSLRNVNGTPSVDWFPVPEATGCTVREYSIVDAFTIALHVKWLPDDQLTLQDDSICNFTISTVAFQCHQLAGNEFNFTLSIFVVAPDPLIPDNILRVAALLGTLSASVLGAVVGGGLVLQQSRASTVLNLANCQFSLVSKFAFVDSPTGLAVGHKVGRYMRGAIIGNMTILVSTFVLGCLACLAGGVYFRKQRGDTLLNGAWRTARNIHFPGFVVFPLAFTFDCTVSSSVSLLFHPMESYDTALGIVGLCFVCLMILAPLTYVSVFAFGCVLEQSILPPNHYLATVPRGISCRGVLKLLIIPDVHWETKTEKPFFKRMYLMVFSEYRISYFLIIELVVSAAIAVAGGVNISSRTICNGLALMCFITLGLFVLLLLWLRPNTQRFALIFSILLNSLTFGSCLNLFMSTQLRDRKYAYYAALISVVVAFLVVLKLLLDSFGAALWLQMRARRFTAKRQPAVDAEQEMATRKVFISDLMGADGGEVECIHRLDQLLRGFDGDDEELRDMLPEAAPLPIAAPAEGPARSIPNQAADDDLLSLDLEVSGGFVPPPQSSAAAAPAAGDDLLSLDLDDSDADVDALIDALLNGGGDAAPLSTEDDALLAAILTGISLAEPAAPAAATATDDLAAALPLNTMVDWRQERRMRRASLTRSLSQADGNRRVSLTGRRLGKSQSIFGRGEEMESDLLRHMPNTAAAAAAAIPQPQEDEAEKQRLAALTLDSLLDGMLEAAPSGASSSVGGQTLRIRSITPPEPPPAADAGGSSSCTAASAAADDVALLEALLRAEGEGPPPPLPAQDEIDPHSI